MIRKEVTDTISKFYPIGKSAYSDEYDLTPEIIFHKKFSKEITPELSPQWNFFKKQLPQNLCLLDYSALPGFNKCFELNFSYKRNPDEKYQIVYYLSILYPAYCYLVYDFFNDSDHRYSECAKSINNFMIETNKLIEKCFPGYRLMSWAELREIVPSFSLQTPDPWNSKVFNFLFTEDPRFDKYL